MRRIASVIILLVMAVAAGVSLTSARPVAQADSNLLQLLPNGTAVIIVDVRKVTSSPVWATLSTQNHLKDAVDKMENGMSELGVKLSDIHSAAIVFTPSASNSVTAAVTGTFNQQDLLARARANKNVRIESEKYKNFEIYNISKPSQAGANKQDAAFLFYDASTIIAGTNASVRASIDVKADGKPAVAQNAKLADAVSQSPAGAVRFAVEMNQATTKALPSGNVPLPDISSVNLIFGTVDVNSGVDLNATLRNDTAEQAKTLADKLNGMLEMVRGFLSASNDQKMAALTAALKTASITNTDVDVKITGNLPVEVLTQIIK